MLAGRQHLQFTNVNIGGTLIVPSGVVLRANWDVTVSGSILVDPGSDVSGAGPAEAGGRGRPPVCPRAASALACSKPLNSFGPAPRAAAPERRSPNPRSLGVVAPSSSLRRGRSVWWRGARSTPRGQSAPAAASNTPGEGGGAGGVIVIAGKSSVTGAGAVRAGGGRGADGDSTGGAGKGGGGGVIHLISTSTPSITGTVDVPGGAAGVSAAPSGGSVATTSGGGGGACGGNGGAGGVTGAPTPGAGSTGRLLQTVTPQPVVEGADRLLLTAAFACSSTPRTSARDHLGAVSLNATDFSGASVLVVATRTPYAEAPYPCENGSRTAPTAICASRSRGWRCSPGGLADHDQRGRLPDARAVEARAADEVHFQRSGLPRLSDPSAFTWERPRARLVHLDSKVSQTSLRTRLTKPGYVHMVDIDLHVEGIRHEVRPYCDFSSGVPVMGGLP